MTEPRRGRPRTFRIALVVALLAALALSAKAWHDTMADPVVRRATVILPALPAGTAPIRVALIADIHVAGPDMPPERLARIVGQVNRLQPDLVLIAGDLVSDKRTATRFYSAAEAIAPLGQLRPRLAAVAVPGNHDHWRDMASIRHELERRNVVVLANQARRFGPLALLLAYYWHVWRGFRALGSNAYLSPEMRALFQGGAAALVVLLVTGWTGSSLRPEIEFGYLWIAIGMMYGMLARKPAN